MVWSTRPTWALLGVVFAVTAAARLVLVFGGWLESAFVVDDAFYYFTIARNVAAGQGPTFDGLAATNGFQPLWQFMLVPVFAVFDDLWTPVRVALALTVLLDGFSGFVIFRIVGRYAPERAALLAASLWWVSPFGFLLGLQGMEASLSTLLILLVLDRVSATTGCDASSARQAVITGSLVGLAGLARTDNLVSVALALTAGVLAHAAFATSGSIGDRALATDGSVHARTSATDGSARRRALAASFRWLLLAGASASVVVAPWFVWNWRRFHSVVQVSGQVKLYADGAFGALATRWDSWTGAVETIAYALFAPVVLPVRGLTGEQFQETRWSGAIAAALLLAGALLLGVGLRRWWTDAGAPRSTSSGSSTLVDARAEAGAGASAEAPDAGPRGAEPHRLFGPLAFVGAYLLVHVVLFGLVWRSYASWYALPFFGLASVLCGWLALTLRETAGRTGLLVRGAAVTLGVATLAVYPLYVAQFPHGAQRPEERWGPAFDRIETLLPQGAVAGAWDAGVAGYVATRYESITVVNLDCLVNNVAFDAVRDGRYLQYLLDTVDVFLQDRGRARMFLEPAEVRRLREVGSPR